MADSGPIPGQNEANFKEYHRNNQRGCEFAFFFKRKEMGCIFWENQKKIKLGNFGAGLGPLGGACSWKIGMRGQKAKKSWGWENVCVGVKIGPRPKKNTFSEKAKCLLSF